MIDDAKLKDAIKSLAGLQIGFCFNVVGILEIRELDSGDYAVDAETASVTEQVFDSLDDAIDYFLAKRHELECGADYEFNRRNVSLHGKSYEWYSFLNQSPAELFFVPIIDGEKIPVRVELTEEKMGEMLRSSEQRTTTTGHWDVSTHFSDAEALEIIRRILDTRQEELKNFDPAAHFVYNQNDTLRYVPANCNDPPIDA